MRMNRYMALQKMVDQKNTEQKKFVNGGPDGGQAPKQAEVRYKVHDHKAHSKGGTLESKVNCRRDECGYGTLRSGHGDRHDRGSEYGTIRGGHGGHMGGGGGHMPPVGHVGPGGHMGPSGGHMVPGGGHVGPGGHIGGGGGGGAGERHGGGHQGGVAASGGQNPTQAAPPPPPPEKEEPAPLPQHILKEISKLYGTTPSDIDKYSRIVFPVCFVCFNLMYWIIYLHISDVVADDLVLLGSD